MNTDSYLNRIFIANRRCSLCVPVLLLILFCTCPTVSAFNSGYPVTVERIVPDSVVPGETFLVLLTVTFDESAPESLRGFFFTEHLDARLTLNETEAVCDEEALEILIETGALGEVYENAFPLRYVFEKPPAFLENIAFEPGREYILSYTLTVPDDAQPGGRYRFFGYNWAGRTEQSGEAAFGYESDPETVLDIVSEDTIVVGEYAYPSIPQGIEAAMSGGKIHVLNGLYDSFTVPVTRTGLTIQAASGANPVIRGEPVDCGDEGGKQKAAICINADNTSIRGFTIGSVTETRYDSSVFVNSAAGIFLNYNNIINADGYALTVRGDTLCANAQNNWWGSTSESFVSTEVTGCAVYDPVLLTGFQGDISTRFCDNENISIDLLSHIGMGVDITGTATMTFACFAGMPTDENGVFKTDETVFFDVFVPGTQALGEIKISLCSGVDENSLFRWFDGSGWKEPVPGPLYENGCLGFSVDNTSSPSLLDLGGTMFGIGPALKVPVVTTTVSITDDGNGGGGSGGGGGSVTTTTTTGIPAESTTTITSLTTSTTLPSTTTTTASKPPPISIVSEPVSDAFVGKEYAYQVVIESMTENALFALKDHPDGMIIDRSNGLITWTPEIRQIGEHTVGIDVTDQGGAAAEQSFTIRVKMTPACPAENLLGNNENKALEVLRQYRDERLVHTASGRYLINLYYTYASELISVIESHPDIRKKVKELVMVFIPVISKALNGGD